MNIISLRLPVPTNSNALNWFEFLNAHFLVLLWRKEARMAGCAFIDVIANIAEN